MDYGFLADTFECITSDFGLLPKRGKGSKPLFADVLEYVKSDGKPETTNKKVAIARVYVEKSGGKIPANASVGRHIAGIVSLIKKANGLS